MRELLLSWGIKTALGGRLEDTYKLLILENSHYFMKYQ